MSETIYEDEETRERARIGIEKQKLGAREAEARRDRIWEDRTE
jgi:hypothetical protein